MWMRANLLRALRQPASLVREQLHGQHLTCHDLVALHCSKVNLLSFRVAIRRKLSWFGNQGTGGVSMIALLICLAAGIQPIITSSSDKKLELARDLGEPGVVQTINYKTYPNWDEQAHNLTDGRGVDIVIDNVGPTAIAQSLSSLARRGIVSLVGFLGGFKMDKQPDTVGPILLKSAKIKFVSLPIHSLSCLRKRFKNKILTLLFSGELRWARRSTNRTFATF